MTRGLPRKIDTHEVAADPGRSRPAEGLALEIEGPPAAGVSCLLKQGERFLERRVVPAPPRIHVPARPAEDKGPAQGVSLREPARKATLPSAFPGESLFPCRKPGGKLPGPVVQECSRVAGMGQTDLRRARPVHGPGGENHREGLHQADRARQAPAATEPGHDPEAGLRKTYLRPRIVGDEPPCACKGKLEPASHRGAVNNSNSGERQILQEVEHFLARLRFFLCNPGVSQGFDLPDVRPGDERTGLPTPDEEAAHIPATRQRGEDSGELFHDGSSQEVELLAREIECQLRYPCILLEGES